MAERFLALQTSIPVGSPAPENLKKKVARNAANLKKKCEALQAIKETNKVARKALKVRAGKYEKEYRRIEKNLVSLRRSAKQSGNFYVEPQPKMMLIIRIAGINRMAPKPKKILQLLRLNQLHKATFVKCTKPMLNMLKPIMPYVTLGYPNLKTVKTLVLKKGYGKVNGQRIPLQSNDIVSKELGKFGVHGVDDLIHQLYTVGPYFKQCNNFLWAFKLSSPNGGYVLKKHGYHEPKGGDWGNREELINEFARRMMGKL